MNAFWWAACAAVIWGIVPLFEKVGLSSTPPTVAIFARSLGIIAGFIVFGVWWSPWRQLWNISVRSFVLLALGGFLASFVGQIAFYNALREGHVSQVTPVAGTYPLVAALLGWLFLREPITTGRLCGVALIVLGAVLMRQ